MPVLFWKIKNEISEKTLSERYLDKVGVPSVCLSSIERKKKPQYARKNGFRAVSKKQFFFVGFQNFGIT
jgi:hypothetical protein